MALSQDTIQLNQSTRQLSQCHIQLFLAIYRSLQAIDTTIKGNPHLNKACEMWAELSKKVPYVLSHCHTKRRTGAWGRACPSFGMTPTFPKKKKKFQKSRCHTKRRTSTAPRACPSFGMTTQDIRELFA